MACRGLKIKVIGLANAVSLTSIQSSLFFLFTNFTHFLLCGLFSAVYAMALCLSVCLSQDPSCTKVVKCRMTQTTCTVAQGL